MKGLDGQQLGSPINFQESIRLPNISTMGGSTKGSSG